MNQLLKLGMATLLLTVPSSYADHNENHDINIENHRIDYGYATQLAYQLADLAEAISYNAMAMTDEIDVGIKDHRSIRYRAEILHQAASDLYYLLRSYRNRSLGILDHREDSVRNAFWKVSNAYHNLNAIAYGYAMQQITNTFYNLSNAINGY